MEPKTQKCMDLNCDRRITLNQIMCKQHWYALPSDIRRAALARMKGWKSMGAARQYVYDWLHAQKAKGAAA